MPMYRLEYFGLGLHWGPKHHVFEATNDVEATEKASAFLETKKPIMRVCTLEEYRPVATFGERIEPSP